MGQAGRERGPATAARLLLVLAALAGLLVPGLVAPGASARAAGAPPAAPALRVAGSLAQVVGVRLDAGRPGARSARDAAAPDLSASRVTAAGPAAPTAGTDLPPALPPAPVLASRPRLLLAQLPRPPDERASSTSPAAARGRAPPAPAGT